MTNRYKDAGVDIKAGYESVELIKKHVSKTSNLGSNAILGGFGGIFDLSKYNYNQPILVSGTDGVGTKLELARTLNCYDTIGIDLVAMCLNDIVTVGAKPLFFLDYIAIHKNIPSIIEQLVKGITTALKSCDCALVGGETAEMPSVYEEGGFDLAGFVVGAVEKEDMIDNTNLVKPNQVIIGLPSSGIHSNGYSLVNKIVKDENLDLMKQYEGLDTTLGEALLCPTKLYVNETLELLDNVKVKAMAHITGGGFYENIKRATHKYGAKINLDNIDILPIFNFLQEKGQLELMEMFSYFNMGIGMIYIIDEIDVDKTLSLLKGSYVIGEVTSQEDIVIC